MALNGSMNNLRILVKFPSRNRPGQFLKVLRSMVEMSSDPKNIHYLISADYDDSSMPKEMINEVADLSSYVKIIWGVSNTKIQAINADMQHAGNWDIVLLASDDMIPQVQGWDNIIREGFNNDLDKALWFFDGSQHRICTLVCMGRKRYEKFGYLYHPSYISLWCDNEWTEVNNPIKFDTILFRHEHPAHCGGVQMDALYQRNESFFERDRLNYEKRKQQNFPL